MDKATNMDQAKREAQGLKTSNNKTYKFKSNKPHQKNTEKEMVRYINKKKGKMLKKRDKTTRKVTEKAKICKLKKVLK